MLKLVGGSADEDYRLELDRLRFLLEGSCSVVCSFVKEGTRTYFTAGDVDADAEAGFLARVLAAQASEDLPL